MFTPDLRTCRDGASRRRTELARLASGDARGRALSASRRRWLRLGKAANLPLRRRSRRGLRTMLCLLSTFAAPTQPQQCLFSGASVRNHSGARVECNRFAGRQVALYFAGEWCPLCRCFDADLDPTHYASVALQLTSLTVAQGLHASAAGVLQGVCRHDRHCLRLERPFRQGGASSFRRRPRRVVLRSSKQVSKVAQYGGIVELSEGS